MAASILALIDESGNVLGRFFFLSGKIIWPTYYQNVLQKFASF